MMTILVRFPSSIWPGVAPYTSMAINPMPLSITRGPAELLEFSHPSTAVGFAQIPTICSPL
jgi:hypothetical protein